MRFDTFLITLFVITLFLVGGGTLIATTMSDYDRTYDSSDFDNLTTITDDIQSDAIPLSNNLKDDTQIGEISSDTAENDMLTGGFKVITQIWSFFTYPGRLAYTIASVIHIPKFIINIFMAMIGISAIFGIVYLVFRFQPRD